MATKFIVDIRSRPIPDSIGTKARNLRWLMDAGFRVPQTYVCRWEAYQLHLVDQGGLIDQLKKELQNIVQPHTAYAVRSSANVEDCSEWSFAGQFSSSLFIQGEDLVLREILAVWESSQSERVKAYLQKNGLDPARLKMAVLIQQMVQPVVSGVAFSRNPVNGANEIVVEAVEGSGETLFQAGHTPQRWVSSRGVWKSLPEGNTIPLELIDQVVHETKKIAARWKRAVDLEWVFNGKELHWVQLREIKLSSQVRIYSNTIAKDMLPGLIKPLVWSVNVPMVSNIWVKLLNELLGHTDIDPHSLVKAFYYRTYFEMGTFARIYALLGLPADTLELMMDLHQPQKKMPMFRPNFRMVRLMPRITDFIIDKARFARKVDAFLPTKQAAYHELYLKDARHLNDEELIRRIKFLIELTGETAYFNIVVPLLMYIYNAVLRRNITKAGGDFTGMDLLAGLDQIREYEPGNYLLQLHELYKQLPPTLQDVISGGELTTFYESPELEAFRTDFENFMERFGHLSDSGNDFSVAPWREQPAEILKMIASFQRPPNQDKPKLNFDQVRFPWWKRSMIKKIYTLARRFRLYREQVSSLYTFGYGLLRVYFQALGDHLVVKGVFENPQDIFYLTFPEAQRLVDGDLPDKDYAVLAAQRRDEMEKCQSFVPPETIYGDQVSPVNIKISQRLCGTPTSRGYYTGRVTVVRGLSDFSEMQPGNVLVIPYSDVGWTPLFLKAGGVISESGGILSHSSIIAREYGIPAVVSVPYATSLANNTMVTVDGFSGEIVVHSSSQM